MNLVLQYPIFGPEIRCPHCHQVIPALLLTDTYLCPRHGAFESDPKTEDLVHVQSSRFWRRWDGEWHRQHTHPDGIRFEIHEALDRLYTEGFRATRVVIADRYRDLIITYFERSLPWREDDQQAELPRLYGLPVDFSPSSTDRWSVVNFELDHEPGPPTRYPYVRLHQ